MTAEPSFRDRHFDVIQRGLDGLFDGEHYFSRSFLFLHGAKSEPGTPPAERDDDLASAEAQRQREMYLIKEEGNAVDEHGMHHSLFARLHPLRRVPAILVAFSLLLGVSFAPSIASPTDKAAQATRQGDFETALKELRPLAAKGDPQAQFLLGMLHDAGKGVTQDQAEAASWYRKAAKQDHPLAQVYLGILLCSGQGVKQDFVEARRWFQAPAKAGNDEAQFYLGVLYAKGSGVQQDDSKAILWLTKSASQRNTRAMGMLAAALFSRSRDEQDLVDAYAWSHLAAEFDPIQALTSARGVIEKYCNKEQKKRGKAVMAEWKRKWANGATRASDG